VSLRRFPTSEDETGVMRDETRIEELDAPGAETSHEAERNLVTILTTDLNEVGVGDDGMGDPSKRCSQCGMVKPLSAFHRMVTGRDGHRAECAACSCDRAKRSYNPRDTGLLRLICQNCGNEFEYVKTSGRRRFYCSDRCKFQAGDAIKKQRAAVEIRTCAC
jgi:hypothetical protein